MESTSTKKATFFLPMIALMQHFFSGTNKQSAIPPKMLNSMRADAVIANGKVVFYTHFYQALPYKRVNGKWRVKH